MSIDANRPFQVFKDLKIGHLHLLLRLIGFTFLIKRVGGVQPLRNIIGKSTKILRRKR